MLYNLKNIMDLVRKDGRGIAAFNVFGYEDAKAVAQAAQMVERPVILMANKDAVDHLGVELMGDIMLHVGREATVAVDVHLDHATDLELIEKAIGCGYTSVMFDGSQLPFEENVRLTCQVVKMARKKGVSVEAEIGAVGYSDTSIDFHARLTDPGEAKSFVEKTGVDALAVAIGTVHRMEQQQARIQFDLLRHIARTVEIPLVIHGSTGVSDEDLTRMVQYGAVKINIGTALRMEFGQALRRQMDENPKVFDRIKLFGPCMAAVRNKAAEKMRLL